MQLTFEGSTLEDIFKQMAVALGYEENTRGPIPPLPADPAQVASEAAKQVNANEKQGTPLPSAKKVLDEAGIPESEYPQIDASGKGGRITKADATMYVNAKRLNAEREEKEAQEAVKEPAQREFPAASPPAAPAPAARGATPDAEAKPEQGGEAPDLSPVEGAKYPDANAALQAVYGAKGMAVTRAVLARFGVERLSQVAEEKYPEFVAYCNAVAEGVINPMDAEG